METVIPLIDVDEYKARLWMLETPTRISLTDPLPESFLFSSALFYRLCRILTFSTHAERFL
jgi:hypothetical protein